MDTVDILQMLGERLREARLHRNETQEVFASRIGLSRQTYAKMEKGQNTIPIGYWLAASGILDRLDTWKEVLAEKQDLFARHEQQQSKRRRARVKKDTS